jgi:uncharacterized protein YuzE
MTTALNFLYDHAADVLYVSKGHPVFTDYVELNEDVILRLDPQTREVVGFTIVDFVGRFTKEALPLHVPLSATFERVNKKQKARVVAESKATYRAKRSAKARRVTNAKALGLK